MQAIFIHTSGGKQGQREVFSTLPIRIGRSSSNDLVITGDDRRASSRHAEIFIEGSTLLLKDLNSTNGTFVNGLRITQAKLNFGDTIEFGVGGPKLRFEFTEAPIADLKIVSNKAHKTLTTETDPPKIQKSNTAPLVDPDASSDDNSQEHSKEFGRQTVQLMLKQAVQQSSRRWKWLVAASFLIICTVISFVIYQQLKASTITPNNKSSLPPIRNADFAEIAARNQRAIVLIYNKFELYDKSGKLIQEQISNGSGFVANESGEIITNRHVIEPWEFKLASNQQGGLANRPGVTGKIKQLGIFFANDPLDAEHMFPIKDYELSHEADVAVLRLSPKKRLQWVEKINGDMKSLQQGDDIIVLSFPLGLEINELTQDKTAKTSLTRGSISKIPDNQKQIQLNVAAYEGSSGGPIFNNSGEVIGLLTSGPNDTLNFGTPIKYATRLLKKSGSVEIKN